MSGLAVVAVPVLETTVRVRIPTIGLLGAVQIMAAVYDWPWGVCLFQTRRPACLPERDPLSTVRTEELQDSPDGCRPDQVQAED